MDCYSEKMGPEIETLKELNFKLRCENEDFVMVFNTLQNREDLKQSEETNRLVYAFEDVFSKEQEKFIQSKERKINELT